MQAESIKSEYAPGGWQAEFVNHEGDGEVYVTIFSGPDAEVRAREYCLKAMTSGHSPSRREQQFFANSSIEELARVQNVSPVMDPSVLSGGIPEDEDIDAFLQEIYGTRK
jgi:hypothetical protein